MARSPLTLVLLLALPLVGLAILLAAPETDVHWEHHPSHFWLVLITAALNAVLAYATGVAARRRGDRRVHLVSLSFLAASGFLALHALATPGVLLDVSFDQNGDLDRESFIIKVVNGKQQVVATVPAVGAAK